MIRLCAFSDEADASLNGQISALKENGIFMTELRSVNGKNVKDFSLKEAAEIAATLKENGISVWSVGSPLGKVDISENFAEYEKVVRHVFALANLFGATRVRAFSFFNAYEKEEEVLSRLSRILEIANECGVILCLENEKDVYGDTVERVLRLLNALPSLRFVYDPANFLQVGCTAEESLAALHARADYFHVKDVLLSSGAIVPAGKGDGKIAEMIAMIDEANDTVLTLEPHLALFEGYAAIDSTEMKHEYCFKSGREAFSAAATALKTLLIKEGYSYNAQKGGYEK